MTADRPDIAPIGSTPVERSAPEQSVSAALKLARAGASDMAVLLTGGDEALRIVREQRDDGDLADLDEAGADGDPAPGDADPG